MPSAPIWNTAAGNFQVNINFDHYWKLQGMHFRGTDSNGVLEIDSTHHSEVYDCIFTGNGSDDTGIFFTDDDAKVTRIEKCRFDNTDSGAIRTSGNVGNTSWTFIRNCLIENCTVAFSFDFGTRMLLEDSEVDTCDVGIKLLNWVNDINVRNIIFTTVANSIDTSQFIITPYNNVGIDDMNGTVGDSRFFNNLASADSVAIYQSETTTVRSGGGDLSIKVTPGTVIGTDQDFNMLKVFEYPIYASTDSKTYTVYFKTNDTAFWTADPTAVQLYIETEAYFSANVADKAKTVSSGVVDFNGSTAWQSLEVTVAPAQAGVLMLRCWYGKPKEAAKTNVFYVDTKPVIS